MPKKETAKYVTQIENGLVKKGKMSKNINSLQPYDAFYLQWYVSLKVDGKKKRISILSEKYFFFNVTWLSIKTLALLCYDSNTS